MQTHHKVHQKKPSVFTTSLPNTTSQQEKEVPKLPQTVKSSNGKWGPFTPPFLNTTKTPQSTLERSEIEERSKPVSGCGQPIINAEGKLKQKTIPHVTPQARKVDGIWKNSYIGMDGSHKGQEVVSQQSVGVENRLATGVPAKFDTSKTTNPLKHKGTSSSHQPSLKQPSFSCYEQPVINKEGHVKQKNFTNAAPQAKSSGGVWKNSASRSTEQPKLKEVAPEQSLRFGNTVVNEAESDLLSLIPQKNQSSKNQKTTNQPLNKSSTTASTPFCSEKSIDNDDIEEPVEAHQGKTIRQPRVKNIVEQASKFRRRMVLPSCVSNLEFDEEDEALTIDASGNHALVSGPISAIDVWSSHGVKYYVVFNDLHQPIRKGGKILKKFLSSIAEQERFCPLGELEWSEIDSVSKAEMVKEIREHFVIPDAEVYDTKFLQIIAKYWRQYKNTLKCTYYRPEEKSLDEHFNKVPGGVSADNWRKLVRYWFSNKGQTLSNYGKKARASQCHTHTSGGRSYADIRANYEDEHGEEMSLPQLYEHAHKRKDGRFIKDTMTEDLLHDTDSYAEILKMKDTSSTKSRKQLEDEAFEHVMYGGEIPKRPQGFGFGVVKGNIYGVNGILRKERYGIVRTRLVETEDVKSKMSVLNTTNENLQKENKELREIVNQNTNLFMSVLEELRSGSVSTQLLDAAKSSLRLANPKVTNDLGTSSDLKHDI